MDNLGTAGPVVTGSGEIPSGRGDAAPIVTAQLSGQAQTPAPAEKPVLRVAKPAAGAQAQFDADDYRSIDLRAVANEQLALVRDGLALKLIFGDAATVTILDFFAEGSNVAAGFSVQVGDAAVFTPQQFAQAFPISTDASVLPAAGAPLGAAAAPQGSGAGGGLDPVGDLSNGRLGFQNLLGETDFGRGAGGGELLGDDAPRIRADVAAGLAEASLDVAETDLTTGPFDATGVLDIDFGRDGFGSVTFNGVVNIAGKALIDLTPGGQVQSGLTSEGRPVFVSLSADALTLTGFILVNGAQAPVFTFAIRPGTAAYTVSVFREVDHLGDQADVQRITVEAVARDGNNSLGNRPLLISLDITDSLPVIAAAPQSASVDEEGLAGGNAGATDAYAASDLAGAAVEAVSRSLGVSWRSDDDLRGPGDGFGRQLAFLMATDGAGGSAPASAGGGRLSLTSDGAPLVYEIANRPDGGQVLTAYRTIGEAREAVFEVILDPTALDGAYTFRLLGNLDHPQGGAEDDLVLAFGFRATDADGDSVTATFTVTVDDDAPEFSAAPQGASVDEENLPGGNPGDTYAAVPSEEGEPSFAAPWLGEREAAAVGAAGGLNIAWGSDDANAVLDGGRAGAPVAGDRSVVFAPTALEALAALKLTSDGESLSFEIVQNGTLLRGFVPGRSESEEGAGFGDRVVFTVSLSDSGGGSYRFTLLDNLDHPKSGVEDDRTLTFPILATDSDGDSIGSSFAVTVNDDAPVFSSLTEAGFVDEERLPAGNPEDSYEGGDLTGAAGDDGDLVTMGSLGIAWGTDDANAIPNGGLASGAGDRSVTFDPALHGASPSGLSSDGQTITYALSANGTVLTATAGERAVFTVSLSDEGAGSYVFTLLDNLDHPAGGTEDDLVLKFDFVATDSDGDAVTAFFQVTVDDDAPVLDTPDAGRELIVNGSFEAGAWNPAAWGVQGTAAGWTYAGPEQALERVDLPYRGVAGGAKALDLDLSPGNVTLSQTVAGAKAGTAYALQFQAGGALDAVQGLEVIWGGRVVLTLTAEQIRGDLKTFTATVIGGDGDGSDTLRFRETGASDFSGTYLANVSLRATRDAVVDEDGGLTSGNPGGAGDVSAGVSASGVLGVRWGADDANASPNGGVGTTGDRSLAFAGDPVEALKGLGLTSNGQPLSYALSGNGAVLTAFAGERTVFQVTLSDAGEGSYRFMLRDTLDHRAGAEDDIALAFRFRATDSDGDAVEGSFTVTVDDDTPVLGAAETGLVDEDGGLRGGNPGGAGDVAASTVATGSLAIAWGADRSNASSNGGLTGALGDRSVTFAAGSVAGLDALKLTSRGEGISYALDAQGDGLVATAGGRTVFTAALSDREAGSYTFTLLDVLDHPAGGDENDIVLTFGFTARDADGDAVDGSFAVTVDDDGPTTTGPVAASTVDEETIPFSGGNLFEAAGVPGDAAALWFAGRSLNVAWGADDRDRGGDTLTLTGLRQDGVVAGQTAANGSMGRSVTFSGTGLGLGEAVLTSRGEAVTVALSDSGTLLTGTAGGRTVFTVRLSDDGAGSYLFTAFDVLEHPAAGAEDDITLTFAVTARDFDGDAVATSFQVSIDDDSPVIGRPEAESVHENDLPEGNDASKESRVQTGDLAISWGADDADGGGKHDRSVAFTTLAAPTGLTSDGVQVVYRIDGATLVATRGVEGPEVFTVALSDDGLGSYVFALKGGIDHTGDDRDGRTIRFGFRATDSDGDPADGAFTVRILDDAPVLGGAVPTTFVDEDALAGGNGAVAPSGPATVTQGLGVAFGADDDARGPGDPHGRTLAFDGAQPAGLTSGGVSLVYKTEPTETGGAVLTAYKGTGGDAVFRVTLDATVAGGAYTFQLLGRLDHPQAGGQNGLPLTFGFKATDADGDATPRGVFTVNVTDDVPTADYSGTAVITEQGTAAGAFVPQSATGTLVFSPGADGARVTGIVFRTADDLDSEAYPALSSGGVALTYETVTSDGVVTLTASAGSRPVFTFAVTDPATGAYTFTLLAPLDHPDAGVGGAETGAADALRLVFDFTVTDGDGDSTPFNAGTVHVDVRDGGPTAAYSGGVTVSETAPGTLSSGQLVFQGGPDGARVTDVVVRQTFADGQRVLDPDSDARNFETDFPRLTSNGAPVTIAKAVSADGVITLTGTAGATPVFTLTVRPDGAYGFQLQGPVDHPDRGEGGAEDVLRLVFDFTVTDRDGDTATDAFQVDVRDSVPTGTGAVLQGEVSEADIASGAKVAGSLASLVEMGADKPGRFTVETANLSPSLLSLTSNGAPLAYKVECNALVARAGANGPVVFTFAVDAGTGDYAFTLQDRLDHAGSLFLDGSRIPVPVSALEQPGDVFATAVVAGDPFAYVGRLTNGDVIVRVTNEGGAPVTWTMDGEGSAFDRTVTIAAGRTVYVNMGWVENNTKFDLTGSNLPSGNPKTVVNPGKKDGIVHEVDQILSFDLASAVTVTDRDGDCRALGGGLFVTVRDAPEGGVLNFGNGPDVEDLSGVALSGVHTVNMGHGQDTLTTSWQHVGTTTTYMGDNGPDRINLVFSVGQLEQILASPNYRSRLSDFLSNPNKGLDLSGSFWNAKVHTDFETATASVWSGGKWTDLDALLDPMPTSTTSGSGDDVLVGAGSGDTLRGEAGDDILLGLGGNDSLVGSAGVDLILGGDGLDTILGGLAGDVLSGGAGSDRFTYLAGDLAGRGIDRILDFETGASGDVIDLGGLLDDAFGAGSAAGDFATATVSGTDITVQVNLDGATRGNWQDVAVLQGAATAGADMIRLYFEGQERPVTV